MVFRSSAHACVSESVFSCLKEGYSLKKIDLKQIIISSITYSESLLLARGQNIFISLDRILTHIGKQRLLTLERVCCLFG